MIEYSWGSSSWDRTYSFRISPAENWDFRWNEACTHCILKTKTWWLNRACNYIHIVSQTGIVSSAPVESSIGESRVQPTIVDVIAAAKGWNGYHGCVMDSATLHVPSCCQGVIVMELGEAWLETTAFKEALCSILNPYWVYKLNLLQTWDLWVFWNISGSGKSMWINHCQRKLGSNLPSYGWN